MGIGQVKFGKLQKNENVAGSTRTKKLIQEAVVSGRIIRTKKETRGRSAAGGTERGAVRADARTCAAARRFAATNRPVSAPGHLPATARRSWRSGRVPRLSEPCSGNPVCFCSSQITCSRQQCAEGNGPPVPGPDHHRQSLAQSTQQREAGPINSMIDSSPKQNQKRGRFASSPASASLLLRWITHGAGRRPGPITWQIGTNPRCFPSISNSSSDVARQHSPQISEWSQILKPFSLSLEPLMNEE